METRLIVSAIIERDGKLLFGKKPQNVGPYPNTWHLLGGGVNSGESITEAIKREVLEESGLVVKDLKQISFDEDYEPNKHGVKTHYIFLVFKANYQSGKLKPKDDIFELKWIEKSALSKVELNRPTIKLFKKLNLL
ncbi:NUDIX domain-containing protein [Candidatus Woesearchaeota archaeon]|nr:NUDIX domain-containing protein [Candidatus Woesearchaeota archaeon]